MERSTWSFKWIKRAHSCSKTYVFSKNRGHRPFHFSGKPPQCSAARNWTLTCPWQSWGKSWRIPNGARPNHAYHFPSQKRTEILKQPNWFILVQNHFSSKKIDPFKGTNRGLKPNLPKHLDHGFSVFLGDVSDWWPTNRPPSVSLAGRWNGSFRRIHNVFSSPHDCTKSLKWSRRIMEGGSWLEPFRFWFVGILVEILEFIFFGVFGAVFFFCEKLKITVFFFLLLLFPRIYFKSMISRDKNHLQADSRIEGKEPDKNTDDCSPRLAAKLGGGCNSIVLGICYPQNTLGLGVSWSKIDELSYFSNELVKKNPTRKGNMNFHQEVLFLKVFASPPAVPPLKSSRLSNFLKVRIHIAKAYKHTAFFPRDVFDFNLWNCYTSQSLTISPQHFQQEISSSKHLAFRQVWMPTFLVQSDSVGFPSFFQATVTTWLGVSVPEVSGCSPANKLPPKEFKERNKGSHQNLRKPRGVDGVGVQHNAGAFEVMTQSALKELAQKSRECFWQMRCAWEIMQFLGCFERVFSCKTWNLEVFFWNSLSLSFTLFLCLFGKTPTWN